VENVHSSGHSPVSQIATHILCILSSTVSPPALNSSAKTSSKSRKATGFESKPVALRLAVWLTDGMRNLWTKWWRLLLPIFLLNSFPFFIMVQVLTIPFPPLCDLCSFSQIFASCGLMRCRRGWNFWVIDLTIWNSYLEFPFEFAASNSTHACFPAAALYPLWAFSVP